MELLDISGRRRRGIAILVIFQGGVEEGERVAYENHENARTLLLTDCKMTEKENGKRIVKI